MMERYISFITGFGCGVVLGMISVVLTRCYKANSESEPHKVKISSDMEYKIVLVVRTDLDMKKGKIAAQCSHAAVGCIEKAQRKDPDSLEIYKMTGETKVALKIDSLDAIRELAQNAKTMGLVTSLIRDAGRTQIAPNSITVLGIGPAQKDIIDGLTSHLKLL